MPHVKQIGANMAIMHNIKYIGFTSTPGRNSMFFVRYSKTTKGIGRITVNINA
jgi:hypothetical protein